MPQRHHPWPDRLLRADGNQTERVIRQVHRDVQSDDKPGRRSQISKRRSSHRSGHPDTIALHGTKNCLFPQYKEAQPLNTTAIAAVASQQSTLKRVGCGERHRRAGREAKTNGAATP